MTTVLVNRKRGGHLAANHWTRHAIRYKDGYSAVCGVYVPPFGTVEGDKPVQGEVKECKNCRRLTADWLWPERK